MSCSAPVHVFALQNEPALSRFPALVNRPDSPLSNRVPTSGLSYLFSSSALRTPRLYRSSISRSTFAASHVGTVHPRHPNGSEISISRTTAILPALITRRAA